MTFQLRKSQVFCLSECCERAKLIHCFLFLNQVCENGQRLIESDHPDSEIFRQNIQDLLENLAHLKQNLEARNAKLLVSEKAQQFFFDANEAEAWMSEQELYMMVEDRGKDEFSAQNLMKKHDALDAAVDDYSNNVRQLGEAARQLIAEGHPDSEQVAVRLAQVGRFISFRRFAVGATRKVLVLENPKTPGFIRPNPTTLSSAMLNMPYACG